MRAGIPEKPENKNVVQCVNMYDVLLEFKRLNLFDCDDSYHLSIRNPGRDEFACTFSRGEFILFFNACLKMVQNDG